MKYKVGDMVLIENNCESCVGSFINKVITICKIINNKYLAEETKNYLWTENSFITIDQNIAPTLKILNNKGYVTKFSCGGHIRSEDKKPMLCIYILFDNIYTDLNVSSINFKSTIFYNATHISYNIPYRIWSNMAYYNKGKIIEDKNRELLEWSKLLPIKE